MPLWLRLRFFQQRTCVHSDFHVFSCFHLRTEFSRLWYAVESNEGEMIAFVIALIEKVPFVHTINFIFPICCNIETKIPYRIFYL